MILNLSTVFFFVKPYNQEMIDKSVKKCVIEAPCKINLHLELGEKREDGFHKLESLFVPLSLSDTIRVKCLNEAGDCRLSVDWEGPKEDINHGDNLVFKAATLFRRQTGFKNALEIHLYKRIPAGAGLGGGSSDAASTLLALNYLAKTGLSPEELMEMAAILGSDVPFFLFGGAARVSGRGERVFCIKSGRLKDLWVLIVKPPFSIDTAFAYRLLDEAREREPLSLSRKGMGAKNFEECLDEDPRSWPFYNDFLPVFPEAYRLKIFSILEKLDKCGASFKGLSGAGSACFGVFTEKEAGEAAAKEFAGNGFFARLTFFLAHKANPVLEY